MNAKRVLEEVDFTPSKEEITSLKEESTTITEKLKDEIKKENINADIFAGGSFAKNTLVRKKPYDVDIFVRFDWRIDDISDLLGKIVKKAFGKAHFKIEKLHGSRDYFRLMKNKDIILEIVPVTKIKHPREARNVTDLSYFHVNYVKKKLKGDMANQVRLAKAFLKAQKVYGAESYISGFSGYAVECLIIHYKSLENMLKQLSKAEERIIIDSENQYKNKNEILFEINESKLNSPIVLVDPTWKERNILAALSNETFKRFQKAAQAFVKNPSIKFFEDEKIDIKMMKETTKKKKADFVVIKLKTDRQPGDIAGTKMKKFSRFILGEMEKYFDIIDEKFDYDGKNEAKVYVIAKSKGEIIRIGPPIKIEKAVKEFKKKNKNIFEKNGFMNSRIKIDFSAKKFLENYKKKNLKRIKEMGIIGISTA